MTAQEHFLAACVALGIDPNNLPDVTKLPEGMQKPVVAHYKIMTVAKHWNGEWEADYSNRNQYKYYPRLWFVPGSGFSYYDFDCDRSPTSVGARLSYATSKLAIKAGEELTEFYNDL